MPTIILYLCIPAAFVLGYVVGRLDFIVSRLAASAGETYQYAAVPQKRAGKNHSVAPGVPAVAIDIDERKVVTEINTAGIQKVSEIELGITTAKQDNIGQSVSKLSQLKGR